MPAVHSESSSSSSLGLAATLTFVSASYLTHTITHQQPQNGRRDLFLHLRNRFASAVNPLLTLIAKSTSVQLRIEVSFASDVISSVPFHIQQRCPKICPA